MSALFRWPCSISIHLSPRLVTGGVRPFPLCLFSCCLQGLSLLVSALFRWPCSISIHLSPRSVAASVRPFPLAVQHFYSSPKSVTAGVRPCPLAIAAFLFMCLLGLSLVVSALFRWPCSISILLSPRSVTGLSLNIVLEYWP